MENDYMSELGDKEPDLDKLSERVRDEVRCRLVIEDDPTVADQPVIDAIMASGLHIAKDSHDVLLIKRGFIQRNSEEPVEIESVTRYEDTKVTVTVEVPTKDGRVALCEIAIVTPEMGTVTVSEHPVYEIVRSLTGDERVMAAALYRKLRALQREFYREISLEITERLKAGSS